MAISVTKVDPDKRKSIPQDPDSLGFGKYFADHMFMMNYNPDEGWHNRRIVPYQPLVLDPAAMVFHYGQEAFEGLKAYAGADDGIYLFRHRDNLARMNRSCDILCMPQFDTDLVAEGLEQLVLLEKEWIPRKTGCSLYIRPTIIATDPYLGVRPSDTYLYYVIVGPVGAYYPEGFNPVTIYVSDQHFRAVRGGIGEAKTGGNYAASLKGQMFAKEAGYSQVLWLDAVHRKYIEEVGTMNIFFVIGDELITSPLTGSILPGITRDSVLWIARDWGLRCSERQLAIDEVIEAAKDGTLQEIFGSGTAAIISPVKSLEYRDEVYHIGDGNPGPIAQRFYDYLLQLQFGQAPDPYRWVTRLA